MLTIAHDLGGKFRQNRVFLEGKSELASVIPEDAFVVLIIANVQQTYENRTQKHECVSLI